MAIINTSFDSLSALSTYSDKGYILKGLSKKRLGFIVSAPDVGKGYLCLSIAYEMATDMRLLGLKASNEHFKTLYWPIEDGVEEIAKRMLEHMKAMPDDVTSLISQNVMLWSGTEALCNVRNGYDVASDSEARLSLIEACKGVDLLIIDTLREAVGNADEVDDDHLVKEVLQHIANEADVAILLVHHLTKAAVRGTEKISNVSGSGFSKTQANSRMHLYLEKNDDKFTLSHIKANYVNKTEKLNQEPLKWTDESLLCLAKASQNIPAAINHSSIERTKYELTSDVLESILANQTKIIEVEPKEITIGSRVLSEDSKVKRKQREKALEIFTEDDTAALKAFYEKRRRDQK